MKRQGFKFVKGRPIRKRKPKTPEPSAKATQATTLAEFFSSCNQPDCLSMPNQPRSSDFEIPTFTSALPATSFYEEEELDASSTRSEAPHEDPPQAVVVAPNVEVPAGTIFPPDLTTFENAWNATASLDGFLSEFNLSMSSSPYLGPLTTVFEEVIKEDPINYRSAYLQRSLDMSVLPCGGVEDEPAHDAWFQLPVGVRWQDLSHKYSGIFTMYDEEFCITPLSMDCPTNPFRVNRKHFEKSAFLLHAIMAISSQHLAKKSNCSALASQTEIHRSTAVQMFTEALCQSNDITFALLDTLIILVNFELTQSASGMWAMHLDGAHTLLEGAGAVKCCQRSPRLRAQIAMLVWWDVTVAFLERRKSRLPMPYLEALVEYDETDGWSFLILNGCPPEFVLAMARLADLAVIYEKITHLQWAIFDRHPVDAIFEEVKCYVNHEDVNLENLGRPGDNLNDRRDRFHCIEAWRHAVLLYICRVFTPEQDSYQIRLIDHLSRSILDHARCITEHKVIQKQLLLPIFLAGSEFGDHCSRSFIRRYCTHWSNTSRFYMFETVAMLLESIWDDWDISTRDVYWWGKSIGRQRWSQANSHEQPLALELLLG
ncbi:fungal-specific transcription factor domain-containing protein [Exophiala viscosa]|nr:fungal-specific transcription factor domain-containing protein [Exophiala viscosa]